MSLETGDKFQNKRWRNYYQIDLENQKDGPKFGAFEEGTVIGCLLDTDRGCMNFFKDGNDLGLAYVQEELREGEFFPFVRTMCPAKLTLFSPKQFPWVSEVPQEPPGPPPEPTLDEDFQYTEIDEEEKRQLLAAAGDQDLDITEEETMIKRLADSMEYIDSDEERRLEKVVDGEFGLLYDMRGSNKFDFDNTRAHIMA